MSAASDFGVFLWLVLTFLPIAFAALQFYYFKTQRKYTLQPVPGSKSNLNIDPHRLRYACLFLQLCFFLALLVALSLNRWGNIGSSYFFENNHEAVKLGLINYQTTMSIDGEVKYLKCDIEYPQRTAYALFTIETVSGTECFAVVGGSAIIFIFCLLSLLLSLYQLAVLQPFLKWNYFVDVQPGQDLSSAMSGGLWVRTLLFVVLHMVMSFMYGVLVCSIGGAEPSTSFYIQFVLTLFTPLQLLLVMRYIQSLPPARSKVPPSVELLEPSDITIAYAAAEETVASAVALTAAAMATIERLNVCIALKETQAAEAASRAAASGSAKVPSSGHHPSDDVRSLAAASAMIRAASEAASAATVAARAGVAAIKPLLFEQPAVAAAAANNHIRKSGDVGGGVAPGANANPSPDQQVPPAAAAAPPIPPRVNSPRNRINQNLQSHNSHSQVVQAPLQSQSPLQPSLSVSLPIQNAIVQPFLKNDDEGKEANAVDPYDIQPSFIKSTDDNDVEALANEQDLDPFLPVNVKLAPDAASSLLSLSAESPAPFVPPAGLSPAAPLDSSVVLNVDNHDDGTAGPVAAVDESQIASPSKKSMN